MDMNTENKNMKVNKSSTECDAHNLRVKAEIDLGLSEAWEPTEQILAQEAAAKKHQEEGFKLAASKKEVLLAVGCVGVADGARYGAAGDVKVEIDEVRTGGGRYSLGYVSGWRLYVGSRYGSNKGSWLTVGDGATLGINTKQVEKARVKIAAEQACLDAKKAAQLATQSAAQRTADFIAANPEFCKRAGQSSFNDGEPYYANWDKRTHYPTAFIALPDGRVQIGSEKFTVAQWEELFALKAAFVSNQNALKASFLCK
jgi:hypothetical protein